MNGFSSATTIPKPPRQLPDADLWEYYRGQGLSVEDATLHVERRRATTPRPAARPAPTAGRAALIGGAQAASSGMADELLGAMAVIRDPTTAITRENIGQQIGAVRDEFSQARGAHPLAALTGNVAGSMVNPLARVLPAPTNAVRGAVTGAALGGAQGLGEGGGSLPQRLPSALMGAGTGAFGGAVIGKLVKRLTPLVTRIVTRFQKGFGRGTPAAQVAAVQEIAAETAVRTRLQQQGYPQPVIEQLIQTMKAGKQIPTAPRPQAPVAQRPGETITPIAPQGFAVTGVRATPPAPTGGSFWADLRGPSVRDLGKGQTVPWYPRGGQTQQGIAPLPAQAPRGARVDQNAVFLEYLKGATPQDAAQRIATLRDLGVPLGPNAEAELLQLLLGAR